jgi:hypothetical protein
LKPALLRWDSPLGGKCRLLGLANFIHAFSHEGFDVTFASASRANFVHSLASSSQPSLTGLTLIQAICLHISACAL